MDENENEIEEQKNVLRDINTGEEVHVFDPHSFCLETVLINTAYYLYDGKEYRFLLCMARKAGLDIEKKKLAA